MKACGCVFCGRDDEAIRVCPMRPGVGPCAFEREDVAVVGVTRGRRGYRYDHGHMNGGQGCRCSFDVYRKAHPGCMADHHHTDTEAEEKDDE